MLRILEIPVTPSALDLLRWPLAILCLALFFLFLIPMALGLVAGACLIRFMEFLNAALQDPRHALLAIAWWLALAALAASLWLLLLWFFFPTRANSGL